MSVRDFLLRLVGAQSGPTVPELLSNELFGVRPGAPLEPRGEAYGADSEVTRPYTVDANGIAEIGVRGILSKRQSFYRWLGLNAQLTTPEMAAAVKAATADAAVRGILLCVDSAGGLVFGTLEVAQAVAAAGAAKPVHCYGRDEFASCAYWIGCQASRVTVNAVAHVGAIGIYSILLDASAAAEEAGFKFYVISTGPYKGAGVLPEAGITEEQLAYFQQTTNDVNAHFLAAVSSGRGMTAEAVAAIADGRCYIGEKAVDAGLADAVGTYEDAYQGLLAAVGDGATVPPEPLPEPELETDSELEEVPPMSGEPQEEATMANPKETPQPTPVADEERGLLAKIKALITGEAVAAAPAAPVAAAPGLTAEQVNALIAQSRTEDAVDRDLAALSGKVPPAVLNDAETRNLLIEAKGKGPERYKAAFALVARQDASALLGGPIADASTTASGHIGLGVNPTELALLGAAGVKPERIAEIEQKYRLNDRPVN